MGMSYIEEVSIPRENWFNMITLFALYNFFCQTLRNDH